MKIQTILDQIDLGSMALPEFQRGYVWNRDQVRGLMHSLYRKHPVGSLLVWVTKTETAATRGDGPLAPARSSSCSTASSVSPRSTGSSAAGRRKFFDGNAQAFTGLHFNLEDEAFEFYAPVKMKDNPLWINVTELMQQGVGAAIPRLLTLPEVQPKLQRLHQPPERRRQASRTSTSTSRRSPARTRRSTWSSTSSTGSTAAAPSSPRATWRSPRSAPQWPEARDEMKARLDKWDGPASTSASTGCCATSTRSLTGEALFSALKDVDTATFQQGLQQAEKADRHAAEPDLGRLGLDHDRVLGGRLRLPADGPLPDAARRQAGRLPRT